MLFIGGDSSVVLLKMPMRIGRKTIGFVNFAVMEARIMDFLAYLVSDRGYSSHTVDTYRVTLFEFMQFVQATDSTLDWEHIDADVVRGWMAHRMRRQIGARTVNRDLSALRTFYRYLNRLGVTQNNPACAVQNTKAGKVLPVFLKQKEMDRLFDHTAFPDTLEGLCHRLILLTFYHTGIRLSELLGLTLGAVDLSGNELKVTGKRNKQRIVPFGAELSEAIRHYLAARRAAGESLSATSHLFVGAEGQPLAAPKVREMVRTYLSTVTTAHRRTPHVLRHTFATALLNNGADLTAVKALLGHESLAATEVYTHVSFASLRNEYEKAHPRSAEAPEKET